MMESQEIQSILPHRYPFLLVDRILEIEPGKKGTGIKNLTGSEWFFQGHLSYPPTLLLESLAQVGGIVLVSKAREENPQSQFIGLFAGVSDFQFQRCPILGEQITLKVEVPRAWLPYTDSPPRPMWGGRRLRAARFSSLLSRALREGLEKALRSRNDSQEFRFLFFSTGPDFLPLRAFGFWPKKWPRGMPRS
jgi:3-hydroxyacyl-[acyl-carrier-protein] dehydratase